VLNYGRLKLRLAEEIVVSLFALLVVVVLWYRSRLRVVSGCINQLVGRQSRNLWFISFFL
jgi:hypothetical protein